MATESGRPPASLTEALFAQPQSFEFVEAVRLLERFLQQRGADAGAAASGAADDPLIRFRATTALTFQQAEVEEIQPPAAGEPAQVLVSFLGLNGSAGVLPRFYSELVLQQVKRKNLALRDFLDIFNDRAIRSHLAAARKYRLPATFELGGTGGADPITGLLFALVGMATPGLRGRLEIDDRVLISFGGLFSRVTRSAAGLAQLLSEYLGHPAEVEQLTGRWARLDEEDRTRLPRAPERRGKFAQLGVNAVLGARVYDVQSRFRLNLGPLGYARFSDLLPGAPRKAITRLVALARTYVGPTLAFDIRLRVRREVVPPFKLGRSGDFTPMLGLNTWLHIRERQSDPADVVLHVDNL